MGKIITISNQKGGVGKTTTAINVSAGLAVLEKKVLLIDMDPQGNASQGLGFYQPQEKDIYHLICLTENKDKLNKENIKKSILDTCIPYLKVITCSQSLAGLEFELNGLENKEGRLKQVLNQVEDIFDYIIIDSPPSLGLLTLNCLVTANSILIPLQCEYYALTGLVELMNTIKLVRENFNFNLKIEGILFTMYDKRLKLSNQVVQDVKKNFDGTIFETIIPRNIKIAEAPSFGKPILLYDVLSIGAQSYLNLANEINNG